MPAAALIQQQQKQQSPPPPHEAAIPPPSRSRAPSPSSKPSSTSTLTSLKVPSAPSPTPTPAPNQPTTQTQTPMPPGPRYLALHKIFHQALSATLRTNSYANFSQCFPTPARHCPAALEGVWRQLNAKLEDGCVREFEAIVAERGVVGGLDGWDGLVEEAAAAAGRRRRRTDEAETEREGREGGLMVKAPHTLSADELHAAHLTVHLQEATRMLEARHQETQQANKVLMERIMDQRATVESLVDGLEGLVADLESGVDVMNNGPGRNVDWLKADTWEMESELRAAGMNR